MRWNVMNKSTISFNGVRIKMILIQLVQWMKFSTMNMNDDQDLQNELKMMLIIGQEKMKSDVKAMETGLLTKLLGIIRGDNF